MQDAMILGETIWRKMNSKTITLQSTSNTTWDIYISNVHFIACSSHALALCDSGRPSNNIVQAIVINNFENSYVNVAF